jgi:chemotaxis protein methyltransferase CheR
MDTKKEIYDFFAKYVYDKTGILYKETDYYRLDSRLNTIRSTYEFEDDQQLLSFIKKPFSLTDEEFILNLFTNNETFFMRDLKPFKALAKSLIPEIKKLYPTDPTLSIWSCACSTGQEVYSIYMSLDSFQNIVRPQSINMEATDLSTSALAKAKSGVYTPLDVQRGLPAPFLVKYFTQHKDEKDNISWAVNPELKRWPKYSTFNLLKDIYPTNKHHIIFCRNVLIYQDQDNKRKVLENIHKALKPGGFLVFGAGESMIGMNLPFKQVEFNKAFFYQKE